MSDESLQQHFEGAPDAMRAWLGTLGWTEAQGINSTPADPNVLAFGPFVVRRIMGQDVAFALLVLAGPIAELPEGVMESDAGSIAAGVMMAGPRKPTPIQWMDRLPAERQVEIHASAQGSPLLAYALFRLGAAQEVDVSMTETQTLVGAMFAAEIITADERAALLAP